jgi:hypothetical protein
MWGWEDILKRRKDYTKNFKNFLVFDIETIKDTKMLEEIADEKEKQKEQNRKGFYLLFSIFSFKIVGIGELFPKHLK